MKLRQARKIRARGYGNYRGSTRQRALKRLGKRWATFHVSWDGHCLDALQSASAACAAAADSVSEAFHRMAFPDVIHLAGIPLYYREPISGGREYSTPIGSGGYTILVGCEEGEDTVWRGAARGNQEPITMFYTGPLPEICEGIAWEISEAFGLPHPVDLESYGEER